MSKKALVVILAILAIVACGRIYFTQFRRGNVTLKPEQAFGQVVAEEVAKLIQNQGHVVIVREPKNEDRPSVVDIQADSLESSLNKLARVKVAAVESIPMSRLPVSPEIRLRNPLAEPSMGLSSGDVLKVMQAHSDANAYVLFGSLPAIDPQVLKSSNGKPQWVVLSEYEPYYDKLFKSGIIGLVIAPRSGPPANGPKEPKTARERFEQDYQVIVSAR